MKKALALVRVAAASPWIAFDQNWRFHRGADTAMCGDVTTAFPIDLGDTRCRGLRRVAAAATEADCAAKCCDDNFCETWQFCPPDHDCATKEEVGGCYIGKRQNCNPNATDGWISRARDLDPDNCELDFCKAKFDDSAWRSLELPHDWSAEDLPMRSEDTEAPVLEVRNGTWRFFPGKGDGSEMMPSYNDSRWTKVIAPHDWRKPPTNYIDENAYAWYRRTVKVTDAHRQAARAGKLRLALGTVVATDETYINGVNVGSSGSMGKESCSINLMYRSYNVPFSVLSSDESVVVAVKVYSPGGHSFPGGFFDSEAADARIGMFDPGASPGQKSTGYAVGGEGWYRKSFEAPAVENGSSVHIRFDGVYMNSDVWLNGKFVGNRPYGYSTFSYDLSATGALLPAPAKNMLVVRVRNDGKNSRWYSGSGIYRHAWLGIFPKIHVPIWGLNVYTPSVSVAEKTASITLNATVATGSSINSDSVEVTFSIFAADGSLKHRTTIRSATPAAGEKVFVAETANLTNVDLWSTDSPYVYRAEVSLDGGRTAAGSTTFGIRQLEYSASFGFKLNGVPTKFQGGCVHHDNGPLGAMALDRAEERRVEILKANGYNAIRTSHNPVSDAFLDACDRLGMMVLDEAFDCWELGKNADDYHVFFDDWWQRDMEAMVLRDRNHPSIVMWSIGNEIPMRDSDRGHSLSRQLADFVRAMDPTGRPVTSAVPGVGDQSDSFFAALDVAGYNYSPNRYERDHQRHPDRMIVATESFPAQSFMYWDQVWKNDYVLGDFIWTAMDYIGESAIGANGVVPDLQACGGYCPRGWDYHLAFCGDIDLVGHQKPQSIYRNVLWNVSSLEIAVHPPAVDGEQEVIASWGWPDQLQSWTWDAASVPLKVDVYSRFETVQLLLNGSPADPSKPDPVSVSYTSQFTATFLVPFAAGDLTAVGFVAGKQMAVKTLRTASKPRSLVLTADRSNIKSSRDDLAYVTVEVVDEAGVLRPDAAIDVTFEVTGAAELAAVGSGDPLDTGSFKSDTRKTYRGRAVAIVRPGSTNKFATEGVAVIKARAAGMTEVSTKIYIGDQQLMV